MYIVANISRLGLGDFIVLKLDLRNPKSRKGWEDEKKGFAVSVTLVAPLEVYLSPPKGSGVRSVR